LTVEEACVGPQCHNADDFQSRGTFRMGSQKHCLEERRRTTTIPRKVIKGGSRLYAPNY